MDRRRFLLTSVAGALAGPLAADGQVWRVPTIVVLSPTASRSRLEDVFAAQTLVAYVMSRGEQ
jgi:hypothetical protein